MESVLPSVLASIPSKKRRRALANLGRSHADPATCEERPARNVSKKKAVEEPSRKNPGYSARVVSKNARGGSPENRSTIGRQVTPTSGRSRVPRGKPVQGAVSGVRSDQNKTTEEAVKATGTYYGAVLNLDQHTSNRATTGATQQQVQRNRCNATKTRALFSVA